MEAVLYFVLQFLVLAACSIVVYVSSRRKGRKYDPGGMNTVSHIFMLLALCAVLSGVATAMLETGSDWVRLWMVFVAVVSAVLAYLAVRMGESVELQVHREQR